MDVNAFNTAGNTALHGAVGRGEPVVELLVSRGATLIKNKAGLTPLDVANRRRRPGGRGGVVREGAAAILAKDGARRCGGDAGRVAGSPFDPVAVVRLGSRRPSSRRPSPSFPRATAAAPAASNGPAPAAASTSTRPLLTGRPIGLAPQGEERPMIAHVAVTDLDADGLSDVLVCDAFRNIVAWVRQSPRGTFVEQTLAPVRAPAHAEAVDIDRDGDLDVLVASLGFLHPNNARIGAVILLENDGSSTSPCAHWSTRWRA